VRISIKVINSELERLGAHAVLARGDGYFYFWGGEADPLFRGETAKSVPRTEGEKSGTVARRNEHRRSTYRGKEAAEGLTDQKESATVS
jgi:hypothetical protein